MLKIAAKFKQLQSARIDDPEIGIRTLSYEEYIDVMERIDFNML